MTDPDRARIETLIEASSLGTPEAKALRESVPDDVAAAIVARSHARYTDDDVTELVDAITDARLAGIHAGPFTLARWLLDRGWRKTEEAP